MLFARISRILQINGARRAFFPESHSHFSTRGGGAATAAAKPHRKNSFLAEYLVNLLGFSTEEAISLSEKVPTRLKPVKKDPNLVISFFRESGLNGAQIKSLISANPSLLLCNIDKTLKPKFEFLEGLGLSGPDLGNFIAAHKSLLESGLDSHIRPRIESLRELLGSDEKVLRVLKRCPAILVYGASKIVEQNLLSLRNVGLSEKKILKFIVRQPRLFLLRKDGWLEEVARRVKTDLGIPVKSSMFYYGMEVLASYRKPTIDSKCEILRSFGWSDEEIGTLVKTYPLILAASEHKLRMILDLLMNEAGYTPDYLASHVRFFSMSLEKNVKLRYEVLKFLNEKKLNKKKASFYSVVGLQEPRFVEDYILPYKDVAPDICRLYKERFQR